MKYRGSVGVKDHKIKKPSLKDGYFILLLLTAFLASL